MALAGLLTTCAGRRESAQTDTPRRSAAEAPATQTDGQPEPPDAAVYAETVVRHARGISAPRPALMRPDAVLGAPDAGGPVAEAALTADEPPRFLSLGCGGELVVAFGDRRLSDVAGPDLEIVEAGDRVEPARVDVSTDGRTWRTVGEIGQDRSRLDVSTVARPGETFRYVRLSDLYADCDGGALPGMDVDAVRALGWREVTAREVRFTAAEPPFEPTSFIPESGSFRIEVVVREPSDAPVQPVTYRPPGDGAAVELDALATDDPLVYRTAPIDLTGGR